MFFVQPQLLLSCCEFSSLPGSNWRESLQINLDISLDSFRSDVSPDHPDILDTESLKIRYLVLDFRLTMGRTNQNIFHIFQRISQDSMTSDKSGDVLIVTMIYLHIL